MRAATTNPTPFFGLGFDMRPAVARAMSLTWVRTEPVCAKAVSQPGAKDFTLWGYALMIALSREIRAG